MHPTPSPSPSLLTTTSALYLAASVALSSLSALCALAPALPAAADDDHQQLEDDMFGASDDDSSSSAPPDPATSSTNSSTTPASDREQLEDDMFGGGDDASTPTATSSPSRASKSSSYEGYSLPSDAFVDTLAVGGRLFMQLQQSVRANDTLDSADLASPNLLDVYLDARPTDRVRAYVRGRVTHDFTVTTGDTSALGQSQQQTTVAMNQLWLKFDIARAVFVTLGRQPIRWCSARFWNPTDFLNQTIRDPLAVFDVRLGVSLLKLHIPVESEGLNIYAIADLEGATTASDVGAALRVEYLLGSTAEVALSASARKNNPLRLGVDLSTALGLFDFRVEAATRYNDSTPYDQGTFDLTTGQVPTQVDRSGEWLTQVAANVELGLKYSDDDNVYFGVEYLFNQTGYGYNNGDLLPWMIFQGRYRPLYAGQHYGAVYMSLPSPGDWNDTTLIISTLGNFSDMSFQTRFDYRYTLLTYLSLNAYVNAHYGKIGEFRLAIDVPANPQLPQGFKLSEPIVDIGLGAQLNF
jgi:hypothetical protein